jgi:hypothetical protein
MAKKKRTLLPEDVQSSGLIQDLTKTNYNILPDDFNPDALDSETGDFVYDEPTARPNVFKGLIEDEGLFENLSSPIGEAFMTQEDLEELKAENQSTLGNILWRGPVRTVAKATQELLKAVGTVGGGLLWVGNEIGEATGLIEDDKKSNVDLIFDNAFNRGVDDAFNSAIFENEALGLKVHVPKKVKEGSFWDNLGDSSFWATEAADAVGFFASMLVPGQALAKLGTGAKIASGFGKLGKLGKANNLFSKLGTTTAARNIDNFIAAGTNTVIEAGAEASGTFTHVRDELLARGEDPEYANQIASEQASKVFGANTALLMGPNMLTNKYLFGRFNPKIKADDVLTQVSRQGRKLKGFEVLNSGKFRTDLGKKLGAGIASEGFFEEGMQTAAEEYFTNQGLKKNPKLETEEDKGFWERAIDTGKEVLNDISGIADKYMEMLPETQMQKAIFLGGLLGGAAGGVGAYRNYQAAQNKIYGYAGPTTKIGELVSKTKVSNFFTPKTQKGIKQLVDEGALTNFSTISDLIEVDEKGQPVLKDNGEFKLNPEAVNALGKDKVKALALNRIIEDAQASEDKQSVDFYLNKGTFNIFKDFLDTNEGVEYLKNEFIPNQSASLINTREKYANRMSNDESLELTDEKIQEKQKELTQKVDEYKKIYDDVNNRHDIEMNIKGRRDNKNTYDIFSQQIKNLKLENKIDMAFANQRISDLEKRNSQILGSNKFVKTNLSSLKKGDIVDYKGEKAYVNGDGTFTKLDDRTKTFTIKQAKEEGKEIPIDIKKLEAPKGDKIELIENTKAIDMNEEFLSDAIAVSNTIYDNKALQNEFNNRVIQADAYNKKAAFAETFTPNTHWTNNQTGKKYKIRDINGNVGLFEETVDEDGNLQYTKEEPISKYKEDPNLFTEDFTKIEPSEQTIVPNIEEVVEQTSQDLAEEVRDEEIVETEEIPEIVEDVVENPIITEEPPVITEPDFTEPRLPGEGVTAPPKPENKITPVEEVTPETGFNETFPVSEGVDTSPEGYNQYEDLGLKRHITDTFSGTANNPRIGTSDDYKGNKRAIIADKVASDFNLAKDGYKLRVMEGNMFPSEIPYFESEVAPLGYKFEDVLYGVLVNSKGEFVQLKDDKLLPLEEDIYDNDNAIFWTLREADLQSKVTNENMHYTPDVETQMEKYEELFPELIDFNGTIEEKQERATSLFKQLEEQSKNSYTKVRENITEDINEGNNVDIKIIGQSKGIPYLTNEYRNMLDILLEIENSTKQDIFNDLEVVVAQADSLTFKGVDSPINTRPGRTYAHSKKTGHTYELQPRQFKKGEVENIVDLLKYYVNNINTQYKNKSNNWNLVDLKEAATLKEDVLGEAVNVVIGGNEIGVFDTISKMIRWGTENANPKYTFGFKTESSFKGGEVSITEDTITGEFVNNYPLISNINDNLVLNPELEQAILNNIPNRYHNIDALKLRNIEKGENENFVKVSNIDPNKGTVKIDTQNYKEYLFDNGVLQTNITVAPESQTVNIHPTLGGGNYTFNPPAFQSVYLKLDYGKYKDNVEEIPDNIEEGLEEVISKEVFDKYVDTGEVSQEILNNIADKVRKNETLTQYENTIFFNKTAEINKILEESPELSKEDKYKVIEEFEENSDNLDTDFQDEFDILGRDVEKVSTAYKKENIDEARNWFVERFPQFGEEGFRVVNNLSEKGLFGAVYKNAVYIDENAEVGTAYHEAFHITTQYLIPQRKVQALYNEWRNTNNKPEYSDRQVEEELAEEFRDYILTKPKYPEAPVKQSIFKKILRWIREFFKGPNIAETFRRIDSGYYKTSKIRNRKQDNLLGREDVSRTFESEDSIKSSIDYANKVLDGVNTYFFDEIRKSEGSFSTFFNKEDNTKLIDDTYNKVKSRFKAKRDAAWRIFDNLRNKSEKSDEDKAKANRAKENFKDFDFILEQFEGSKFEALKDKHANLLREYGLDSTMVGNKRVDITPLYDEDSIKEQAEEDANDRNAKDSGWELADRSIKFSAKMNAQKSIKLLVGTLPELSYDETNDTYKRVKNELGLPKSTAFGRMFNSLLTALTGTKTLPEVVNKLKDFQQNIPAVRYFFTTTGLDLNKVLENDITISADKMNEIMQLSQTFGKTENTYSIELLSEGGEKTLIDSNQNTRRLKVRNTWKSSVSDRLSKGDKYFTKEGRYKTNEFKKLNITKEDKSYLDVLKAVGIEFTNFEEIKNKGDHHEVRRRAVHILSRIQREAENSVPNIFTVSEESNAYGDLNTLLDIEYNSNIDLNELSHVGLEGDLIYNHTLNSYISNVIDNINKFQGKNAWNDMIKVYPHLNSKDVSFLKSSLILRKGGILFDSNGKRRPNSNINLITAEGISENEAGTTTEMSKLSNPDRMSSVLFRASNGMYNMIRPADKKLERYLQVDLGLLDPRQYLDIFKDYLSDEITRTIEHTNSSLGYNWNNYSNNLNSDDISRKGVMIEMINKFSQSDTFKNEFNKIVESKLDPDAASARSMADTFINNYSDLVEAAISNYFNNKIEDMISWSVKNRLLDKVEGKDQYENNGLTLKKDKKIYTKNEIKPYLFNFLVKDVTMNIEQTKIFFGDPIYFDKVSNFFKRTGSFPGTKKLMISDFFTDSWVEENLKRTDGAENLVDDVVGAEVFSTDKSKTRKKAIVKQYTVDDITVWDDIFGEVGEEADGMSWVSFDEYREMLFRSGDWSFGENSLEDLYQWEMQNYFAKNPNKLPKNTSFKEIFGYEWNGTPRDPRDGRTIDKKPDLVINPLKPLYVGPYAEKGFAPGITKTSFGVMFPSLIEQFPNLEEASDFMRNNKIGVLSFKSANKGAAIKTTKDGAYNKLYNKEGKLALSDAILEGNEANSVLQNTYYEYWGIQLDTGFKSKDEVITGTQMMKQIIGGLYSNGEISPEFKHLKPLIDEYIRNNNERLNLGKQELLETLDIKIENGQYVVDDYNKFKTKLKDIANKRGMADNVIDSIDLIDDVLGLEGVINRDAFEAAIFGLNDKLVIKQKRKGTAAYQIPSTMFETSNARSFEKGMIKASEDLKMYEKNEDGSIGMMEVYLPDRYKGMVNMDSDGRLLEAIAFRIPTQGLASIEAIRVKGFLPKEAGDSIVLPSAIVKKAGSDYDIDKLNIYLPNYFETKQDNANYISSKEDYQFYLDNAKNPTLSEIQYKKFQAENRITEIQKEILLNPTNYDNLTKPLDSNIIKELADEIYQIKTGKERAKGSLLDIVDRVELTNIASRFLESKDAVGITALASPFHIMAQMSDLKVNKKYVSDREAMPLSSQINMPHNKDEAGNILISNSKDVNGNNIGDALSQWISEAVDAAKDPRMFDLNVNLETLNVVLYLTMAGVPTDTILYFINQPIIQEFIEEKSIGQSKTLAVNTHDVEIRGKNITVAKTVWDSQIIDKIKSKYARDKQPAKDREYSSKDLKSLLNYGYKLNKDEKHSEKYGRSQIALLNDYLKYKEIADKVTTAIQGASWDTNSAGKSVPDLLMRLHNVDKTLYDITEDNIPTIINYNKLLQNETSFLNPYYQNNKDLTSQFAPLYKLSLGDSNLRGLINNVIRRFEYQKVAGDKKSKILSNLVSSYINYQMITKPYNTNIETTEDNRTELVKEGNNILSKQFDRLFSGNNSTAKRLLEYQKVLNDFDNAVKKNKTISEQKQNLKRLRDKYEGRYSNMLKFYKKYRNNILLRSIIPVLSENVEKYYDHIAMQRSAKLDLHENAQFTTDWSTLYNDANPSINNFALDLFKTLVLQDGIKNSPINFLKLVPSNIYDIFVKSTVNNRLSNEEDAMRDAYKFFEEWHIDNMNNNDIVPLTRQGVPISTMFPFAKLSKELLPEYKTKSTLEVNNTKAKGIKVVEDNFRLIRPDVKDVLNPFEKYFYKLYNQSKAINALGLIKPITDYSNINNIFEFKKSQEDIIQEYGLLNVDMYNEYLQILQDKGLTSTTTLEDFSNLSSEEQSTLIEQAKKCK